MNQRLMINFEKELNGIQYSFSLPMGVKWTEALCVVDEFSQMCVALAQQAEEKYAADLAAKESDEPAQDVEVEIVTDQPQEGA